jgi:hypothetical protein
MSRTDVHAPAWVKEHDPAWRHHFEPVHVHTVQEHWDAQQQRWLVRREVPCDLADFRTGARNTRCRLRPVGGRNIYCGCRNCTGYYGRRWSRRRERAAWRAAQREALRTAPEDRDAIDVVMPLPKR